MLVNLVFLLAAHLIVWIMARSLKSLEGFLLLRGASVAAVAILSLPASVEGGVRAVVISMLAVGWGLRLALHHYVRERYLGPERWPQAWIEQHGRGWHSASLRRIVLPQVGVIWLATSTIQHGIIAGVPFALSLLDVLGILCVFIGVVIEAAADRQLLLFRQGDPTGGAVLDSGLWNYSRHPNHFGAVFGAWGFYLLAAAAGSGLWGLVGVIVTTVWFARFAGPRQETGVATRRPGYAIYERRVSPLLPKHPKAFGSAPMPKAALKFFESAPDKDEEPPSETAS